MEIDDRVYVSFPKLIGFEEAETVADLSKAIHEAAVGATEISILGGYYNVDALVGVCKRVRRADRGRCRVRIAVGLEATALIPRTWSDMRSLSQQLRDARFRDVTVAVVARAPVHFHTKLFRILRTTRPTWFVGSANPGSERHELMVRLTGRHDGLSAYVDAVFASALVVGSAPPPPVEIATPRDFFLSGMLCHKPPRQHLFSFDAFRFTVENRDRLAAVLAGEAGVEHARPRAEGFGFGLRSALGLEDAPDGEDALDGEEAVAGRRIPYQRSCVETVLGLWMPNAYAQDIAARVEGRDGDGLRRLEAFSNALDDDAGQKRATDAFRAHVASMERLLAEHRIPARPVRNRDASFARFLRSRTATLGDPDARQRLARSTTLTAMPDIWDDDRAREAFTTSFFEDLAYRADSVNGGRARVVRSLIEALQLEGGETPEEIRGLLTDRIKRRPWTDIYWQH